MAGLLYWYALEPAHGLIFGGLKREICRRAEDAERTAGGTRRLRGRRDSH